MGELYDYEMGEWKGWAHNPVNHIGWVAAAITTDGPGLGGKLSCNQIFCGE